jgi:hypothetical protein
MANRDDIEIHFRMKGDSGVAAKRLIQSLDDVEASLYESDRRDIEQLTQRLELPSYLRDACLERLRHHRHRRFLITEARPGSLEIVGLVAGVVLFVLHSTVGEAFRDGFSQTNAYARLMEYFRDTTDQRLHSLAEIFRRYFHSKKHKDVTVRVTSPDVNSPGRIIIEVPSERLPSQPEIATIGEQLRRIEHDKRL